METKARISNISRDFSSGKILLTFQIDNFNSEEVERLMSKDLRLRAVVWREKRSLDSNGYLWVLCEKIAQELNTTKDEVYELMLQRYGTLLKDDDEMPYTVTLPSHLDIGKVEGHFKLLKQSKDGKFNAYAIIKGSSEYDSKEMSVLLSGVVEEAKEMGIDTATPEEIQRMNELWQSR